MEKSDIKRNTNTWKIWTIRIKRGKHENQIYNKILIKLDYLKKAFYTTKPWDIKILESASKHY